MSRSSRPLAHPAPLALALPIAAAAAAAALAPSSAFAAETGQGPMPTYAPPPNYAPAPQYAPPPPPPQYNAPQYAPPPGGGGYGGGSRYYGSNFDIARPGLAVDAILGFGARSGTGFALGAGVGYTLPFKLYLGGDFTYFTGNSYASAYTLEGVVGYDLAVIPQAPVLIRPYGAIGFEEVNVNVCVVNVCASGGGSTAIISLGVMGQYFFTPNWSAGVDLRLDIDTNSNYGYSVFDFFGMGAYKF